MQPWMIVTGASGALANVFIPLAAKHEWRILAVSRKEDFIPPETADITRLQADVSSMAGVDTVMQFFKERNEVPECLVHLAGSFLLAGLGQTSETQYRHCLAANLDSAFFMLKAFVAILRKNHTAGNAVFVSSVVADIGVAFHEAVAAAKGGLESLVMAAAATHARDAIRINAVRSGLMDSPAASHILRNTQAREMAQRQYPLGELIDPALVAEAIIFLLQQRQMTGQILSVDAGFTAIRPLVTS
ncbi:SDR family oxidoreductase [Acidithiobacillus marinus]|uniref:SDR family oxidoreductase n=1 Tax=Acidithiobacillus marinus TaxID=187490 RepID=A0A2I1DKZ3_9PROT|nr:SDR family oxidoreductase [Acidithiobacillus marinus]PKY10534.1 SDR family oxidoreductase [Acidithiobacillus marinus]